MKTHSIVATYAIALTLLTTTITVLADEALDAATAEMESE
jgi:hypothetical protein